MVIASRAEARNVGLRERPFRFFACGGLQAEAARAVVDLVTGIDPQGGSTVALDRGRDTSDVAVWNASTVRVAARPVLVSSRANGRCGGPA